MKDRIINLIDPRTELLKTTPIRGHSERGLTLIEIIVVLMMVGIIGAFIGGKVFKAGDKAKAELTRAKLNSLKEPIYIYQMRNSALPQSLAQAEAEDTKDAWGREVQYRVMDGRGYEIRSLGGDGRDGGSGPDADIVVTGP
jgi:general secretion pathway protein G